ncbi:MAG: Gfo/Idh/MocA family protein [Candidatus Methylacidiphilales bacterium]|nr:Gfo/Idh/MocA family oxidoreductase [Candidatus Methylacidiphilales bacterium]
MYRASAELEIFWGTFDIVPIVNEPLRIGVTGLGRAGWDFHCKTLATHPDFKLVAVADSEESRRWEASMALGCEGYPSHDIMIQEAQLDAVVVASPTHLHRAMAVRALEAGLHVMVEKPMAPDATEARAIVAAAEAADRVVTVHQAHRLAAYFQQARHIVSSGQLGVIYHARRGWYDYARRDDWQAMRQYGGGMLLNYGAHFLDQLLAITGGPVNRVFCQLRRVAGLGDAEDVVKVVYETEAGSTGEVDINFASALNPYELELFGTHGTLSLRDGIFTVRWFEQGDLPPKELNPSLASPGRLYPSEDIPFKTQQIPVNMKQGKDVFEDFARAIRTDGVPYITSAQTLRVMDLIDRCRFDAGEILRT